MPRVYLFPPFIGMYIVQDTIDHWEASYTWRLTCYNSLGNRVEVPSDEETKLQLIAGEPGIQNFWRESLFGGTFPPKILARGSETSILAL